MAKVIAKEYGRKVVDGIDVYEVGQQQYIELSQYDPISRGIGGNSGVYRHAKGLWVVVSVQSTFGGGTFGSRVYVEYISRSRRDAVEWALWEVDNHTYSEPYTYGNERVRTAPAVGRDFEIWHIVDDGDLWQAWDLEAASAGGDLQAAQQWEATFYDDKYLRQIEDQYTGDYHVYDTSVGEWPGVCIADVTQYDLAHGYKYVYEHWTAAGEVLKQCVEDTEGAAITCGWYRDGGWRVMSSDVTSIGMWAELEVLRDDGTAPVWCPLRVCFVCWSEE